MFNDDKISELALRFLGTLIGVLASVIMVAPDHTRAAFGRVMVGVSMGIIFAPTIPAWGAFGLNPLSFLTGPQGEMIMARSAACGFTIWFILEFVARMLSSTEWLEKLARTILEDKARRDGDDNG